MFSNDQQLSYHVSRTQRTLRNSIGCVGTGLHTGARVAMTLHPAAVGHGIAFRRLDRPGSAVIPARFDQVIDTTMCNTLAAPGGAVIATVEHLMAALAGLEVDNALVEIDGPEVPIMDGSAEPFLFLLECAGVVEQDAPRRFLEILQPISVEAHGRRATLAPGAGFDIDCRIEFEHPLIRSQALHYRFDPETFRTEISSARTFGFAERIEELWSRGLALGGSLKNAVVVSRDRVLNEEGLRFQDEFVRHKVLDSVGDLYLAGAPIHGRFTGVCTGHALHNKLLRALFQQPNAWRYSEDAPALPAFPAARLQSAAQAS